MNSTPISSEQISNARERFDRLRREIHRQIIGQHSLIDRLLIALLADGHVLLEGVPGLAKTKTLAVLTKAIDASMSRIQFTPDLLPSDLIGTEVYRPQLGDFVIRKGPIFTNLLLTDEINRAPAKVQSALLQAMQERQVTIGEHTFELPTPFLVLATQNPIEQEGTYQLPEAQLDRFLMKIKVSYPSFEDEVRVVELATTEALSHPIPDKVISIADIAELRKLSLAVRVEPALIKYIVSLVHASRSSEIPGMKGMIEWGASPRASIALEQGARALALMRGKPYATPDEVRELAPDMLRHRILTTFEAQAKGITSDDIVAALLKSVPVP